MRSRWMLAVLVFALLYAEAGLGQQQGKQVSSLPVLAVELDKVQWKKDPKGGPLERFDLVGSRSKPGLYIQLVKWPPRMVNKAHSHPDDRYGLVLRGTFYHGYGDKFDEGKLEMRPAGTFFTEPAHLRHFGITRDEGAILYFVGTGPSTNDNPEK
jgi:hypothetical protein